jgi:hypothetical protein
VVLDDEHVAVWWCSPLYLATPNGYAINASSNAARCVAAMQTYVSISKSIDVF